MAQSGPEMGVPYEVTTQTWGEWGPAKIPAGAFLNNAQSVKIKVVGASYVALNNGNGNEGAVNGDIDVRAYNGANKAGVFFNVSDEAHLVTAKAGDMYLRIGGGSVFQIFVTNYDTVEGAANDNGTTPSGGDSSDDSGNSGSDSGNTGGSNSGMSLADKIANKQQLTDVPTIYLTVPDAEGKDINTILKKENKESLYYPATIQVVDNSAVGSEKHLDSFTDNVEIKVRGNSTAQLTKKPYRLKFAKDEKDEAGNVTVQHKHDLTGDGYKKRNWTLLANYYDGAKIRNALNYRIGQLVGMEFCPGYKFVDLVINGEYRGCYQVSDHVEVGSHRIDVDEDTGWYVEASRGDMIEAPSATGGSLEMSIKNPEPVTKADTAQLKSDVKSFFDEFGQKAASYNTNLSDPTLGWRSIADEESMVAFYIGTNLTANYDGFMTVKMFRDVIGSDTKLHFGPLWDMDLAYGHFKGSEPGKLVEDIENGNFRWYPKTFMENDARFVKKVYDKWHTLINNGLIDDLKSYIDKLANTVRKSQELDYSKWPVRMKGMDGTYESFDEAIAYLKGFIEKHVPLVQKYIDDQYTALHCADLPDEPEDAGGGEDTPVGSLGALKYLENGKYSYTGSASTFKVGTKITITTFSESTTLSNYITEGNTWNTEKSITLTAADITALAANNYTFFMNATGGDVVAVNVKVPSEAGTLKYVGHGTKWGGNENVYTYVGSAATLKAGNTITISIKGAGAWSRTYSDNQYTAHFNTETYTIKDEDVSRFAACNYTLTILVEEGGTCESVVISGGSSSDSGDSTPQYTLTLSASDGGTVSGAGTYDEGTTVLIKAIPDSGYKFVKWSDENTYAVRSVTVNEAIELTATFVSEDSPTPAERAQLTNLPTIYLDAASVDDAWRGVALEVFDKDNKLGQGATWTKTTTDVSMQYQGSGAKNKDSYRLKFESKIKLLGTTKYKQWVLLANDDDPSMINNALAKELGDIVGMPWTPGYQFVDLYVNNEYMGTYQVTDRVKAEDGRSLVTGGNKDADWQVRFNDDDELREDGTTDYISTAKGIHVIYKNPDPKDLTVDQITALRTNMEEYFGNVFKNVDDTYPNFAENVDKEQIINWYVAQEILGVYKGFSSIEAYRSVTETATDKLLHFGPLWDSEKAFGNHGEAPAIDMSDKDDDTYLGLMTNYAAFGEMKSLFNYLWTQPWFGTGVIDKWNALLSAGLLTTLKDKADAISATLSESQAENARKWTGSLGDAQDYATTIINIKNYLTTRFEYLGVKFAARAAGLCEHTYNKNEYADNGDGTHSLICDKCSTTKTAEKTVHHYIAKEGHPYCEICKHSEDVAIEGSVEDDTRVYRIHESEKATAVQFVAAEGGFAPSGNNIYICDEEITETTNNLTNVVWPRSADADYNANNIVLSDGDYIYDQKASIHAKSASYTRNMSSTWGTLCLPFKIASCADYTLYEIANTKINEDQTGTIVFSQIESASGLQPVVFRKNTNASSVTFRGVAQEKEGVDNGLVTVKKSKKLGNTDALLTTPVENSGSWALYGNVKKSNNTKEISPDYNNVYYIASNKFWRGTANVTVGTFRAVFVFTPTPGDEASAKSFSIAVSDNATTGMEDKHIEKSLAIFVGNGEVIIDSNYDTNIAIYRIGGTLVANTTIEKGMQKRIALKDGVYIINGTKVTVK